MTIIEKLDKVLEPMGFAFYPGFYANKGEDYGVYDEITDEPDMFADDEPNVYIRSCRVHIFVKKDREKQKRKLRVLLRNADFTIGETYEQHEENTGYTHITFEVSDVEGVCADDDYETEE